MGLSWGSLMETALDQLREARKPQVEPQRFLAQLEMVATILRVDLTDRSYRDDFTPNYRVLFDRPGRKLYIYELFNCFDCEPIFVNGKLIRISPETRHKGKHLKKCYHELLETLDAYFHVGAIPDLEKMQALLARFDRTWVDFEKLYFEELFKIEAEARAPIVRAMQLEHKLRTLETEEGDDRETPHLKLLEVQKLVSSIRPQLPRTTYNERFEVLKQLVQLTAGLNSSANVAGRGRDDLSVEVLVAAADRFILAMSGQPCNQLETYHREVQRVLASRVLQNFVELRKYFRSISDIWKEVDPQLCNNRKLVDALSAWEVAWELGNRSLLKQDVLESFSSCAALTLDAQRLTPDLPRLIDSRDAELFLILPRLVLWSSLESPARSGIIRELLPHLFKGGEGAEGAEFQSRLLELQEVQRSLLSMASADKDFLTRQVISGPCGAEEGNEKLRDFLLTLEGLSVELQRYRPVDWNQICSALLECVEAVSGRSPATTPRPERAAEHAQEDEATPDFEPSASLRRAMRPWCF